MNTILKGDAFEEKSAQLIAEALENGDLGLISSFCKVKRKPKYFSRYRENYITFDISIEVWPKGAKRYHLLYLIECKDYSGRAVPVDDIEEFVSKIDQVAGKTVKGVFITTSKLQESAFNYAKSKGLMVIQVSPSNEPNILLHNISRTRNIDSEQERQYPTWSNQIRERGAIATSDMESLDWDQEIESFISRLFNDDVVFPSEVPAASGIDKLSKPLIEKLTIDIINCFNKRVLDKAAAFPMTDFIKFIADQYDLTVTLEKNLSDIKGVKLNAYCDIKAKKVFVDASLEGSEQYLFVCAHEIGHFILHSNIRLIQEAYDNMQDSKYDASTGKYELLNDKNWIEWQANRFASSLILPERCIMLGLITWQIQNGISRRGRVWVDNQPCNISDFKRLLTDLAYKFQVSRSVLKYRMDDLGITKYANGVKINWHNEFGISLREPRFIGEIMRQMFQ